MATDFAVFLRRFLTGHLAGLRGYSPNTIVSYRDTFKLLICYFRVLAATLFAHEPAGLHAHESATLDGDGGPR